MKSFGVVLKEARNLMGWDQRSFATALRMSDKTIANIESRGSPEWPAAQDVLNLMDAYEIKFARDFASSEAPGLKRRYFLTLDFRFDPDQEDRVRIITRRMQVVGMSVVRRLNQARDTMSSFDGAELHVPPINRVSFDTVLSGFVKEYGPIDCLVRNRHGMRLTEESIPGLWAFGTQSSD